MTNIKTDTSDPIKKVFQSIGFEKPSPDFTLSVVGLITKETIRQPVAKAPFIRFYYYLLLLPAAALFFFIPTLMDWISEIKINLDFIHTDILKSWVLLFIKDLRWTVSPAMISIIIASFILVTFLALISYNQTENNEAQ
jgi:hypothetical protein